MKCPCENETYLCETPCMDKCPYEQGKADAIDEFINFVDNKKYLLGLSCNDLRKIAEQFKGN